MEHLCHDVSEQESSQTEVKRVGHTDGAVALNVYVLVQSIVPLSHLRLGQLVDVADQELSNFDWECKKERSDCQPDQELSLALPIEGFNLEERIEEENGRA